MDKYQILSTYTLFVTLLFIFIFTPSAFFQQAEETSISQQADLAQELTNPLADLVTISLSR